MQVISDISVSEYKSVKNTLKKWFNKDSIREFKRKLQNTNWQNVLIQRNINNAHNPFWKSFYLYVAKDFHWLTKKSNNNLSLVHGWQKALLNDPKKKQPLHKKYLAKGQLFARPLKKTSCKTLFEAMKCKSKKSYYSNLLSRGIKTTWRK